LQTGTRRSPKSPEREPPSSSKDVPKEFMEQVTHAHTFLNELEKYPFESDCMSWSRTLPPARSATSGKAGSLSDKLVGHNSGPMGTKHGTRIPNRLFW